MKEWKLKDGSTIYFASKKQVEFFDDKRERVLFNISYIDDFSSFTKEHWDYLVKRRNFWANSLTVKTLSS